MNASGHKSLPTIGFLTVIEQADIGLTGGYLVLNTLGRPLEFHCTAPVKTNRAQEILYGPTLKPFLYGEQIGQTLLGKSRLRPLLVCTNCAAALAVRETVSTPVALVLAEEPAAKDAEQVCSAPHEEQRAAAPPNGSRDSLIRIDSPHTAAGVSGHTFALGARRLLVATRFAGDQQQIVEAWGKYAGEFDLLEPFDRIREAIAEAQKGRSNV
jgi:hypothetical protein